MFYVPFSIAMIAKSEETKLLYIHVLFILYSLVITHILFVLLLSF